MRSSALPISVVLAGALVGLGLYFGLRGRAGPPAPSTAPPQATLADPLPVDATPVASVAPPPDPLKDPIGYAAQQAKASARLKQAMEVKRATWVAKCWKPSARANPEPAKQTFQVRVLFDTSGRRADFAVGEPSAKSRSDVASCLRDNPPDVTIEAPKAPIGIQQSFELP